jgi:hypothetical protein
MMGFCHGGGGTSCTIITGNLLTRRKIFIGNEYNMEIYTAK